MKIAAKSTSIIIPAVLAAMLLFVAALVGTSYHPTSMEQELEKTETFDFSRKLSENNKINKKIRSIKCKTYTGVNQAVGIPTVPIPNAGFNQLVVRELPGSSNLIPGFKQVGFAICNFLETTTEFYCEDYLTFYNAMTGIVVGTLTASGVATNLGSDTVLTNLTITGGSGMLLGAKGELNSIKTDANNASNLDSDVTLILCF